MITIHYCTKCGAIHDKPTKYYDKEAKKDVFQHKCMQFDVEEQCMGELRMISLEKKDILGLWEECQVRRIK